MTIPWNDAMNAEARELCRKSREENQICQIVDDYGNVVPPPAYRQIDHNAVMQRQG